MGIRVTWETDQKRIIRQTYEADWNWDDYQGAFLQVRKLADEIDYPIGLISEFTSTSHLPNMSMVYGSAVLRAPASNIVLTVVVTHSNSLKALISIIIKVNRFTKLTFAQNADEAQKKIEAALEREGAD